MTYKEEHEQVESNPSIQITARRQHITAIIFMFVKSLKELIFAFGIGIFLTIKENWQMTLLFGGGFFLIVLIFSLLSWLRFTYRVEENELRIESGVIIRQKKYVPLNRIHTIDYSANVIHRLFKLVKVNVDTGSGGASELKLSAITREEGDNLRSALGKSNLSLSIDDNNEKTSTVIRPARMEKITWRHLIMAASTSGGFGALLFAAYLGGSQLLSLVPEHYFDSTLDWFSGAGMTLVILSSIIAIVVLYIIGITGTVLKYAFFTIEQYEDHLFIKRGLLETKELTIPYERIQSITIKQNVLRQLFGFVSIHATVVGNIMEGKDSVNPVLFPFMHKRQVEEFIEHYLPQYVVEENEWVGLPKKALTYYIGRMVILPIIITIVIGYFYPTFIFIPIIFVILFTMLGILSYRTAGYRKDRTKLQLKKRFFQKQTKTILRNRIQTIEKSQHKLQQIQCLSTVHVSVFSGTIGEFFAVTHFADEDVNKIGDWYSRKENLKDYHSISREIEIDS